MRSPSSDSRRSSLVFAALRVLSLSIMAAVLIGLFVRLKQEAARPRQPSVSEKVAGLRSEGIKYMDVQWGDWRTRLEGEPLSRALDALDTACEPTWIGWSGDEWIVLGQITVVTASEQVNFLIETRKTIAMRPLIYANWARAGHRNLSADQFFVLVRAMKPGTDDLGGASGDSH